MHECKISLGKTIKNARQEHGFSQQDLCKLLVAPSDCLMTIDRCLLAKIENNRVDVRSDEYDCLMPKFAEILSCDIAWLETLRQQTEVEPFDLSKALAVFPVYFNQQHYEL